MSEDVASGSFPAQPYARMPKNSVLAAIRRDYLSTPVNAVTSALAFSIAFLILYFFVKWALIDAVWSGAPEACLNQAGACWAVVTSRYRLILFGLYPYDEQWRSALACVIVLVTVLLSCIPYFWSAKLLPLLWIAGYAIFFVLMRGGVFGLQVVHETQWGGLALTMFVFAATIVIGMPLAIVLALLRRSRLVVVSKITAVFIDAVRTIPFLAILFTVAILLPYALPSMLIGEKLYRVIFGSALYFAVYQAEVIRSGMRAIAAGQEEAAQALGLSFFQSIRRIVLPQAFRYALPSTINQVVSTFLETSMIVVIGFFELTASGNAAFSSGGWNQYSVEVYVFVALLYFSFTFSLSRYGAYLESKLKGPVR